MLNNCVRASNAFPPFFLTVSMMEKIVQKLDPPSKERKVPAIFIFSLLSLKLFSPIIPNNRNNRLILIIYYSSSFACFTIWHSGSHFLEQIAED
ncbi:hypothetical protein DYP60_12135 [Sphaerochaeta halotolerans]|uniref:Uncharacterized protein n=1 Tax=Sphaerochaeta halotolerans TaxID=2293840 RepID=A0A372MEY1_9SPIR|nr:hypothetical protein DYP60_12135 [Sphaerochaeta halotolerans]